MEMDNNTEALVRSAKSVLNALKDGRNPTFDQLTHLEGALWPFVAMKLCGHVVMEDCDCMPMKIAAEKGKI